MYKPSIIPLISAYIMAINLLYNPVGAVYVGEGTNDMSHWSCVKQHNVIDVLSYYTS